MLWKYPCQARVKTIGCSTDATRPQLELTTCCISLPHTPFTAPSQLSRHCPEGAAEVIHLHPGPHSDTGLLILQSGGAAPADGGPCCWRAVCAVWPLQRRRQDSEGDLSAVWVWDWWLCVRYSWYSGVAVVWGCCRSPGKDKIRLGAATADSDVDI